MASVKCTPVAHEIGKQKYVNQPLNLGNKWYMELFEYIYIERERKRERHTHTHKCLKVWFNALMRPLQSHNSTQM
jgi:hypothetical protein